MTPYFSKIRDNRIFQFCVVNIIILNAVLIGATTYNLDPLFLEIINYLDYGITIFFVVEIIWFMDWLVVHTSLDWPIYY